METMTGRFLETLGRNSVEAGVSGARGIAGAMALWEENCATLALRLVAAGDGPTASARVGRQRGEPLQPVSASWRT